MRKYRRIPFESIDVLVDPEDYWICEKYRVAISPHGYVMVNLPGEKARAYLHRMLLNYPRLGIDHIDGNPLNNKKSNLRICTQSENMANGKLRKDNATGVPGVWYVTNEKLWYAQIQKERKQRHIGCFRTFEEAKLARLRAELEIHGQYAGALGARRCPSKIGKS